MSAHPAGPSAPPTPSSAIAHPPETVEGWYVLHQMFRIDPTQAGHLTGASSAVLAYGADDLSAGWSGAARLIGSTSDVMFIHFRRTLDDLGEAQRAVAREPWMQGLIPTDSFLSVTEAGLYHVTAQLAKAAAERGGSVGDEAYVAAVRERVAEERESAHTKKRLYPPRQAAMPYVCFYPMSKRREGHDNWYMLPLDERSNLMRAHSLTGRRYAGRVFQIISGSIGFETWEWGVTLFAKDPLEFKKLVTEMRFDEVSARYAEFGAFVVGKMGTLAEVLGG